MEVNLQHFSKESFIEFMKTISVSSPYMKSSFSSFPVLPSQSEPIRANQIRPLTSLSELKKTLLS